MLVPLMLFGMLAEDVIDHESFFFDDPLLLYARGLASPAAKRPRPTPGRGRTERLGAV